MAYPVLFAYLAIHAHYESYKSAPMVYTAQLCPKMKILHRLLLGHNCLRDTVVWSMAQLGKYPYRQLRLTAKSTQRLQTGGHLFAVAWVRNKARACPPIIKQNYFVLGDDGIFINTALGRDVKQSFDYYPGTRELRPDARRLARYAVDGNNGTESSTREQHSIYGSDEPPWWKIFVNLGAHQHLSFIRIHREFSLHFVLSQKRATHSPPGSLGHG